MKLRDILAWDLFLSIVVGLVAWCSLPSQVDGGFLKDVYSVSITSLSIIFSVYFAALAIIMVSGDNAFVRFLEEERDYSGIVSTFKFTLILLFLALIASIVLYVYTSAHLSPDKDYKQAKWLFIIFTWLSSYALFAVFMSAFDAIHYAKLRTEFFLIQKEQNNINPCTPQGNAPKDQ